MKRITQSTLILAAALSVAAVAPTTHASSEAGLNPTMQIKKLAAMCAETADARAARQAANPLYDRLGGYDRIHELTTEIVRRHNANPDIEHYFSPDRAEMLAKHVADFVSAGTGGTATYAGRDMPTAHRGLDLSEADFLSAGNDIAESMKALGYGQNEIDEILCILVSLKDQVLHQ